MENLEEREQQKREKALKVKIENTLWVLCKNFKDEIFDTLLKSPGIASYVIDISGDIASIADIEKNIQIIIENRAQLEALKQMPQVKQRSPEWFALRRDRLTASDTGQAMNRGHYGNRAKLVENKAFPESVVFNNSCPPLKHGTMYEAMTSRSYSQRNNNMQIHEFGLIPHSTLSCYGASPDGITEMGVLIEIKTPWRRKVNGDILDQYELQMQGQMAVTGINECDFIDCEIEDMKYEDNYLKNIATNLKIDHGVLVENLESGEYIYSPPYLTPIEAVQWKNSEIRKHETYKVYYWKVRKIYIERLYFDKNRWENELVPAIQSFWNDVIKMKERGRAAAGAAGKTLDLVDSGDNKKQKVLQFIDSDEEV
uniref:YqaJ viral recombinase domain-containing protein n=1 Tax=viral metagenome TaxID=1070528 RepID=A0A6C0KW96_9ZZZZ